MIPKISTPLAKDIRTGEGIFEYAVALVLAVAAVLPHGLSWTQSGLYMTILAGVKGVSRRLVKVSAINAGLGIGAPIVPAALQKAEPTITTVAETVIPQAVAQAEHPDAAAIIGDLVTDAQEFGSPPPATQSGKPAAPAADTPAPVKGK